MIPKKIHYCWFGYNKKSNIIKKCIKSWKEQCLDFEIIEWNETNFNINISNFTKQAYKQKKWAYVADYARFYILEKEGGIYLDTDMFLFKDLSPLLQNNFFLGIQHYTKGNPDIITIAGGIIGMKKNHNIGKDIIDYYNNIKIDRKYVIPLIIKNILTKKYNISQKNEIHQLEQGVILYPIEYFYAYDDINKKELKTNNTFSIHYGLGSWLSLQEKIAKFIVRILVKLGIKEQVKSFIYKFIQEIRFK